VPNIVDTLAGETQAKVLGLLRRAPRSITELSHELDLTDNAIRTHIAGLSRDGLVEAAGSQRDTGGKPARLYRLSAAGEELFPKAYALALNGLVEEIARTEGWERAVALLRGVGTRVAAGVIPGATTAERVDAAAATLRELGADIDVERAGEEWTLRGYACPLATVTARHHEVCSLVTALVAEITGRPVTECCERGERPKCRFQVGA
jgi:predicted ArsR family transcriptional regulator